MFVTDACWRMNGSTYDTALDERSECAAVSAEIRREAVPLRPVLAHEAIHYIEIPDYDELNRKFDAFCARVGDKYLADNEISRPRYFTELPRLIQRKNLTAKMPDYIQGSRIFKQMGIKTYLERLRLSQLCGYEMLQFADCLKYENKNGIVDFFDDDKYFDADWMNSFNGDGAILAEFENETFYYDEAVKMILFASDFLEHPVQRGTVEVRVDGELVWCGRDVTLAGNLQKIAEVTLRFKERTQPAKATVAASFTSGDVKLENSWSLWLYPRVSVTVPAEVEVDDAEAKAFFNAGGNSCSGPFITDKLNDRVFEQLESGRHVLLLYHRDRPGNQYYLPGALERFKPCIWDRGSNLGGFFSCGILSQAVGGGRYFEANMQPLLEAAYKVNLDKCTLPVQEHINGIDKPVRDRMKGLVDGIKDFIDDDTLRNFSHCFSISLENGAVLTVCTLNFNAAAVTRNFHAALINNLDAFKSEEMVSVSRLRQYVQESTDAGICREDVMNHFWEIDNKPVEDTLFWEATGLDLSKLK
ncbi:MAG: hypothetical protein J6S21_04780 [Victivallales bacterium]|nr:hypothetical protein [Victivallales bacterium]